MPNFLQTSKSNITTCPRLSRSFRTKRLIFDKGLAKYQSQDFNLGQNHRFDAAAAPLGVSTTLPPTFELTAHLWAARDFWTGKNWKAISFRPGPTDSRNKNKLFVSNRHRAGVTGCSPCKDITCTQHLQLTFNLLNPVQKAHELIIPPPQFRKLLFAPEATALIQHHSRDLPSQTAQNIVSHPPQ